MIAQIMALLVAVVVHECAHAGVAYLFGDSTAYEQKRLTLNPIRHLDIIGSVIFPLALVILGSPFLIGWAKPVPVNYQALKYRDVGVFCVAFAGPLSNFVLASFSMVFLSLIIQLELLFPYVNSVIYFLIFMIKINVVLALFNLLPLPPLDGSKMLGVLLPKSVRSLFERCEPFGLFVVMGLFSVYAFQDMFYRMVNSVLRVYWAFFMESRGIHATFLAFFTFYIVGISSGGGDILRVQWFLI